MGTRPYIDGLVRLRRDYTGESWQQALHHVQAVCPDISHFAREWFSKYSGWRAPGDLDHPIIEDRLLRRCVLPDTTDHHQRRLETAVLLAVGGPDVIKAVSPQVGLLAITPHDGMAEPFLRRLLAGNDDQSLMGQPGLRVVPARRHVALHLLVQDYILTLGRIVVSGVGEQQWRAIWRGIRDDGGWRGGTNPLFSESPQLTPVERDVMGHRLRRSGHHALASRMLRRFGLLGQAWVAGAWIAVGRGIDVEIHTRSSICSVLQALQHPLAGMVGGTIAVDATTGPAAPGMTFARIVDTGAAHPAALTIRPPAGVAS
jgi:hypothetical protein